MFVRIPIFMVYAFVNTTALKLQQIPGFRGGEISKMYTCPRTTGCKKTLVRTKALLARTQINAKARFVNIMI